MVNFKQILTEDNTEPNTAFVNQLRSKLPEFFTKDKYDIDEDGNEVLVEEGGFDIQKFQDSLQKNNVNEITDGYTLNFVGKKYAELQAGKPTVTVVIPDTKHNSEPKNAQSENVFLTGDNLDALKHLQRAYTNSIDVIYIDPPYNTGSDGFVYNDKFDLSDEDLRDTFNMSEDEIKKLHLLNGRSSHSAWLTFMYPRLKIAQQLLKDSGVIFVSIDDNEQANLKLLMDEIFGEGTEQFIWNKEAEGKSGTLKQVSRFRNIHEYIISGYKNINRVKFFKIHEALTGRENEFQTANLAVNSAKENENHENYFSITNPNGEVFTKQWKWNKQKINQLIKEDLIFWGSDGHKQPRLIIPTDERRTTYLESILNYGGTTTGRKDFEKLLPEGAFSYPKPVILLKKLLESATSNNAIILDFFAGSATTADAIMQLNAEDGGNRKWILNTLDEKTPADSAARKAGYITVDEISRDRIKQASKKVQNDHPELDSFDAGFKHYYVKEIDANTIHKIVDFDPNSIQILTEDVVSEFAGNEVKLGEYYEKTDKDKLNPKFAQSVDTGASGEDTILQTWLINDGYKFDVPVKTIELVQHNVNYVEDGAIAYIVDQFTQDDVEKLLNLIGKQQLNVKTIIVFGYSFDFASMTSLKNNVKAALDGVRVEVRY
ncbi:site-specific DNA-methyltransferase [Leuconostoc lactis]|uniref:site-specific DNA-methyltransferase n=1 Tax=Leuconostoc lactis TaxID=1246 RepID=UPI00101F764A|nr:site-specific DNA-methyltransferase [Leuconostoc lactis]MSB67135.1 site-specific DNA-methyltransferase [Leuconostoc lactis]RYS86293.1 site-specific DNA-methyltransferase [Leuconostoc lactis]